MNRLEAPSLSASPSFTASSIGSSTLAGYRHEEFGSSGLSLDSADALATFTPVHYEEGYDYPLLVWLHGEGQSQHDLPAVMAGLSVRNYVAVAPQAIESAAAPWPQTADGIHRAEERVAAAVDNAMARFSVNPERIVLAGAGQGGTAALRIALSCPHKIAGAASFDGAAPMGHTPFRNIKSARHLPLMVALGSESGRYPQAQASRDLRLMHSAGLSVDLRVEPGDGDLTHTMLAELNRWIMQTVCGANLIC